MCWFGQPGQYMKKKVWARLWASVEGGFLCFHGQNIKYLFFLNIVASALKSFKIELELFSSCIIKYILPYSQLLHILLEGDAQNLHLGYISK